MVNAIRFCSSECPGLQASGDKPGNKTRSGPLNCFYPLPTRVDEDDPGNDRIGDALLSCHDWWGRKRSQRFPVQLKRHEGIVHSRHQENVGSDDEEEQRVR